MKPNKIIQEVFGSKSRIEVTDNNYKVMTPNLRRKSLDSPPKEDEFEEVIYCDNKEILRIKHETNKNN